MAIGIDISENNRFTEWDALKDAGVEFIIIRAGYGQGNLDSWFYESVNRAQELGLRMGAYWFSYALDVDAARREGEYCREIIDLPIFYDQEDSDWRENHDYNHGIATAQCDAFADGLGLNTGVYANCDWFTHYMDYDYLASKYTIWLAQYAPEPELACGIWQYSAAGSIGGNYPIDMNTANF